MGSLKKNFIYQTLYQILVVILPLITAPYIARVLGADNSGIYSYSHTIANYFVVFGMLGLEQYGNRCIAKVRDDRDETNRVFSELLLLHIIVSAAAAALYFVYCFTFAAEYRFIFLLQGFYAVSVLFDVNWFFFGIEKFRLTVTRNTVIKLLTVAAMFIFVRSRDDLWIYTFILSLSMLLSQIAVWPSLRKYVRFVRVPPGSLKKHLKPLLLLFAAVIAANLNRMIDKAMLGWFGRITDLGCYDYADRIVRIPLSFIAAIGTVMLSKMSNLTARGDNDGTRKILDVSACLVLMVSFGMGFGIAAVAPEMTVWFLGDEDAETAVLLSVLAVSIPIVGWNNFIRTQILIPKEMDMIYTRAVTAGAAVNIVINCFLIYFFGARGASVATVVSYAVIMLIQTIPIAGQIKGTFGYTVFPVFAGAVMYAAVRSSSMLTDALFPSVIIELVVGIVVYGGLCFAYLKIRQPHVLRAIFRKKHPGSS